MGRYKPEYSTALAQVRDALGAGPGTERLAPATALGRLSAATVRAPAGFPAQRLAGMDGMALGREGGHVRSLRVRTGEPVPAWVEGVVPEEELRPGTQAAQAAAYSGRHLFAAGGEYRAGEVLVAAGQRLGPGEVAALEVLGIDGVVVRRRPRVVLVQVGDGARGAAIGTWLSGFVRRVGPAQVERRRLDGWDGGPKAAAGADLAVLYSDTEPGRYLELRHACFDTPATGVRPGFWKADIHPSRHLGFVHAGDVPALVFPDLFAKTVLAAWSFLLPALVHLHGVSIRTQRSRWVAQPPATGPWPYLAAVAREHGAPSGVRPLALDAPLSARGLLDADGCVLLDGPARSGDEAVVWQVPPCACGASPQRGD